MVPRASVRAKVACASASASSHPDLNLDDAGAEARFKAISAAHDLLKDPATRARFDAGEIDDTGAERPPRQYYRDFAEDPGHAYRSRGGTRSPFGDGADPNDIFADIFRQRGAAGGFTGQRFEAPGRDLRFALEVPFLDAARGAEMRLSLGDGGDIAVKIPPGAQDGQTLRLRGKGNAGQGDGPSGDALITLSVRPHPVFSRDGDDILVTLPVTIDEAILGAKVAAPTITGPVSLTIPPGASSGRVLRLRARLGLQDLHGAVRQKPVLGAGHGGRAACRCACLCRPDRHPAGWRGGRRTSPRLWSGPDRL